MNRALGRPIQHHPGAIHLVPRGKGTHLALFGYCLHVERIEVGPLNECAEVPTPDRGRSCVAVECTERKDGSGDTGLHRNARRYRRKPLPAPAPDCVVLVDAAGGVRGRRELLEHMSPGHGDRHGRWVRGSVTQLTIAVRSPAIGSPFLGQGTGKAVEAIGVTTRPDLDELQCRRHLNCLHCRRAVVGMPAPCGPIPGNSAEVVPPARQVIEGRCARNRDELKVGPN